jgi:hypothetical protein
VLWWDFKGVGASMVGTELFLRQVMMYPLSEYDGTMQSKDWSALPKWQPTPGGQATETQWTPHRKSACCQIALGHTKIESTMRYLGIEVDDAR